MQAAEGKAVVTYVADSKVPHGTTISIGFPSPSNWFVVKKLMRGIPCGCATLANGSEATCLAYAIYDSVKAKLTRTTSQAGVSSVQCNYRNGEFSIHIICGKSVKKVLSTVAKCMRSSRDLYSKYSANIQLINFKPVKSEYITVYNELVNSLILNAVVVTRYKLNQSKVNALASAMASYLPTKPIDGTMTKPSSLMLERGGTSYPNVTAKSWHAMFGLELLNFVHDTNAVIANDQIICYDEKKMPPITADHIDKYVRGFKGGPIILYTASAIYHLDTYSLLDLLNANITAESVKEIVLSIYNHA